MSLTIYEAKLSKEDLLKLPEEERTLFFALSHFINEISISLRTLLIVVHTKSQNAAEEKGNAAQLFFFMKLLAGKLLEGSRLLQNPISKKYSRELSPENTDNLKSINKYFGERNLCFLIRNHYAFHYSQDELNIVFPKIDEDLSVFLEDVGRGNNLYYFAEIVTHNAMLSEIDPKDIQRANLQIVEDTSRISKCLISVYEEFLSLILEKNLNHYWESYAQEVAIGEVDKLDSLKLPWFIDFEGYSF